jgi:hypothetical protein
VRSCLSRVVGKSHLLISSSSTPHPPLCRCRFALAAAAVGLAGAVTEETSTPTSDSNYMVMQGNIGYASTGVTPPPPPAPCAHRLSWCCFLLRDRCTREKRMRIMWQKGPPLPTILLVLLLCGSLAATHQHICSRAHWTTSLFDCRPLFALRARMLPQPSPCHLLSLCAVTSLPRPLTRCAMSC